MGAVEKESQNRTQEVLSFFLKENGNGISKYSLSQIHAPLSEEAINKSSRLIIAWLFPRYHTLPDLPVLTSSVVEAFQKDDEQGEILRNRFHQGLILILDHYGLKLNGSGNVAKNSVKFDAQAEKYLKPGRRHLTRIQWVLRSLVDLGQFEIAQSFCTFLDGYTRDEKPGLRPFFEECNRIVHPPKTEVRRALFTPPREEPARDKGTQGVLDFFLKNGNGSCAHLFDDIISKYNENDLEHHHNFIQWLFPTHRKSDFVGNPPILNPEIIGAFNAGGAQGEQLRLSMRLGFVRMLRHYGLQLDGDGRVQKNPATFDDQSRKYLQLGNHNIRRISCILSSLVALGQVQLAKAFYNFLDDYTQNECKNLRSTFNQYWKPICDWDAIPNPGPSSQDPVIEEPAAKTHSFNDVYRKYQSMEFKVFIRWLGEKEEGYTTAPVESPAVISAFNAKTFMGGMYREALRTGVKKLLDEFYGLTLEDDNRITKGVSFGEKAAQHLTDDQENVELITKTLSALVNLGQPEIAKSFYTFLDQYTQTDKADLRPIFEGQWKTVVDWDTI